MDEAGNNVDRPRTPLTLGAILRAAREAAGLTQPAAAAALEVAETVVSEWENERRVPSRARLLSIGDVYGAPEVVADCVAAVRTFAALPPDRTWALHPPSGRMWAWVRGIAGGTVEIRWGPWRVSVPAVGDPDAGFVITAPYGVPAPPLFVDLPNPGWVVTGRDRPPGWLSLPAVDAWPLLRAAPEPHVVTHRLARLIASPRRSPRIRHMVLLHLPVLRPSPETLVSIEVHVHHRPEPVVAEVPAHLPDVADVADTDLLGAGCAALALAPGGRRPLEEVLNAAADLAGDENPLTKDRLRRLLDRGVFTDPAVPALLDRVFGFDGRSFCAESDWGTRGGAVSCRFPAFWRGPVWVRFEPRDGDIGAPDVTLRWGAFRKDLHLAGPTVVESRCGGDVPEPLIIEAPGWRVRVGMGRHPKAFDVNNHWTIEVSYLTRLIEAGLRYLLDHRPGR